MGKLIFPEIKLEGVKGVFLDIDNTIYHYDSCHKYALNILINELFILINHPKEVIKKQFLKSRNKINNQLHGYASSHSRFLYIQLTLEKFLEKTSFYHTLRLEEIYWNAFLDKMRIDENAHKFINLCYSSKIPICCVTDLTAQIQFRKIVKLNLEQKINFIVTSEEAGIEKPNKLIFNLSLEKINLEYKDVIMIGDSISKDIRGAEELGIKTYFIKAL
jgi:FMN phosphatase YigB (HAD superfamily)